MRNVYVDPDRLSLGIGLRLAEASLDQMRAAGARSISLGVFPSNVRAIAFYERLGFTRLKVSTWHNNGVAFEDQIMLRKL